MSIFRHIYIFFNFQFETWWSSLTCVASGSSPRFVVDGQAPLRQCLHPEACNKLIDLPAHYNVFHDLRKEFSGCYSTNDELQMVSIQEMIQCILFFWQFKKTIQLECCKWKAWSDGTVSFIPCEIAHIIEDLYSSINSFCTWLSCWEILKVRDAIFLFTHFFFVSLFDDISVLT